MAAPDAVHRRIALDDGGTLVAAVRGRGPTMLVHNGLVSTELHWRPWIARFADRFTVVTWDYRGHGASPRCPGTSWATIAGFAADGHDLLARLDVERPAIVCAISMGVQVALEHWRRHPEDVRALLLLCGTSGHPFRHFPGIDPARDRLVRLIRWLSRRGAARPAEARVMHRALAAILGTAIGRELAFLTGGAHRSRETRASLDELFGHVLGMDLDVVLAAVASYLEHGADDVLPTIRVPTLIMAGGDDLLTPPAFARWMRERVPGATLEVVHGQTHLAQIETPEIVHALVERFLARHGLAPRPAGLA